MRPFVSAWSGLFCITSVRAKEGLRCQFCEDMYDDEKRNVCERKINGCGQTSLDVPGWVRVSKRQKTKGTRGSPPHRLGRESSLPRFIDVMEFTTCPK